MATLTVKNAGGRRDYYQILGVSHTAGFREIGAGYWRLARGAAGDQRAELNEAYETLNDEDRRRAYDAQWVDAGHVEAPRPEPAYAPPALVMAQVQPVDAVEASRPVEERRSEPANAPPQREPDQPDPASSEPETRAKAPAAEPDDSLSFAERLGWPKAM